MNAETQIREKLLNNLGLKNVEVINNSHLHKHHTQSPNSGISHFKLVIRDKSSVNFQKLNHTKKSIHAFLKK